jgi:serine/threonine protein kinase
MNEGVRITDFYRFDEVLGEGTFSIVYLAESKIEPDGWVAIKVIEKKGREWIKKMIFKFVL